MWNAILDVLKITLPFITKIVEAKFIPASKDFIYKNLDEAVNLAIQSLTKLKEKIKASTNEFDNMGFELGLATLKATAEKILKAVEILDAE